MSESEPQSLSGMTFLNRTLRETRFIGCDLSEVVVRGSLVAGMEIDSPWLLEDGGRLLVNGVDVVPLVDAELNRRFPGRADRRATDPEGLATAWDRLERTWDATLARVGTLPPGTVDVSVAGEWSFAQTLRHLVLATDTWLRKAILGEEQPYHPYGLIDVATADDGFDVTVLAQDAPSYDEVLEVWAGRVAMVRDVIAGVTPELLASDRPNPHDPDYPETVLSCLHTILEEEWEHHRYAVRDLDVIEGSEGA